jgi:hypothetical protein
MWTNLAALVFQKPAAVCASAAAVGQEAMAAGGGEGGGGAGAGGATETAMDVRAPHNGR